MAQEKGKNKRGPLIIAVVAAAVLLVLGSCAACMILGLIGGSDDNGGVVDRQPTPTPVAESGNVDTPVPTNNPEPTATPVPTNTPEPTAPPAAPSCREMFAARDEMTDVQWDAYKEDLSGKWILNQQATIRDVGDRSLLAGGYPIYIDIIRNCDIYYVVSDQETAMQYGRNQSVVVTGQIDFVEVILGTITIYMRDETVEIDTSGQAAEPTPEPVETPADSATAEPPAPTAEPEEGGLGVVVERGGYSLVALAVEDPAPPGSLYTPSDGTKLVAVEVIVGNASSDSASINPLNAILIDQEGYSYDAELAGRDGQIDTLDIEPGERVRGWVAFQVPEGSVPATLRYEVEGVPIRTGLAGSGEGVTIPPRPEADVSPPPPIGEEVQGEGVSFVAFDVEDPAAPGMFYTQREGFRLVAVEVAVGNVSRDGFSSNPLKTVLVDRDGFVYTAELAAYDGEQLPTMDLGPGERTRGWVAFELPDGAMLESVKFEVDMFPSVFLRAGLQ